MKMPIKPVEIDGKTATMAEVSASISHTVAVRIVPLIDGEPVEKAAIGIVGSPGESDVDAFLASMIQALGGFVTGRNEREKAIVAQRAARAEAMRNGPHEPAWAVPPARGNGRGNR